MTSQATELDHLEALIRDRGGPVSIDALAREHLRLGMLAETRMRTYAPGSQYRVGETLRLDSVAAEVISVESGSNPQQGKFDVLTLRLPDGSQQRWAAGVANAPTDIPVSEGAASEVDPAALDEAWKSHRPEIMNATRAVLEADPRFVEFADMWCLYDLLPPIDPTMRASLLAALPTEPEDDGPVSCSTEDLVEVLWNIENDGSQAYVLHAFVVNTTLALEPDIYTLGNERWVSRSAWNAFAEREQVTAPRMQTQIELPDGIVPVTDAEAEEFLHEETRAAAETPDASSPTEEDLTPERWRQQRRACETFTLRARDYYAASLSLTKPLRRLFPHFYGERLEILFNHHFGDAPEMLRAWVDFEHNRILLSREMYETFRRHKIYPGARLQICAVNDVEYQMTTRERMRDEPVQVWRMWLDEETGEIEYAMDIETPDYDIDPRAFIADVRFEDIEALFQQAAETGNSIFGLMYEEAKRRWEEGGRESLTVTVDELYPAIHASPEGRMTSKATIAVELWQRLAFEAMGGGRYRFRPEFGALRRGTPPTGGKRQRAASLPQMPAAPATRDPDFWNQVTTLQGRRLYTLAQHKPFDAAPTLDSSGVSAVPEDAQSKMLFSRHYLETRLPDHAEWREDPGDVFKIVARLWAKARRSGDAWNEAQTEEEFIKPMLDALGWAFIVQAKSHTHGRVTRPDYALFSDEATKQAAYHRQTDEDAFYGQTLAIGEAKYWGRALSRKDSSGRDTWKVGENPSHQMVSYLVGTRAPWGILTNGQVWRLYSREVSSTASEFYEVDLALLFDFLPEKGAPSAAQWDAFRRWWLFFRKDAFIPDARGKSFVQRVHEGSATYAREISDKLKDLVFTEVMPEIAGGFVAYRRHQLGVVQETAESLHEIYQASLSLLYKLLFLLYAEARRLLPVHNPGYREQSLTALAQWAADRRDQRQPLSTATHATPRYEALLALFRRIDQGDPSLGIPRYNGGLFNPQNPDNAFLEQHRLSDRAVAHAVDILVRDAGQPVDYAYISVRNLGAIYEGLLENRLQVVDAAAGQVTLVNDKGERKATGSYYTPDYIVDYIVQHTLAPVLATRAEAFTAAMNRVAEARHALQRTPDPSRVHLWRPRLETAERDAREAFLGIKVLDPAMGSGHFLVNAVDFLTDGIIQRMQAFHDDHPDIPWAWNPIQQLIERVRKEILEEMQHQGIAVDPARLDDTALLTRLVMKRCIYGVDLNKMAVELAKLSLWLHSFTVGAPLSFLDHHLRWGNSLIGADVRTVEQGIQVAGQQETGLGAVSQFGLFSGPFSGLLDLTALMVEVVDRADVTLSDVRRSAGDFETFQHSLVPYKQILDLWVSRHFGNAGADEFLRLYGSDVLPALKQGVRIST
ncbi:MAG: hypothetical protein JXD18_01000 [Anaerolineae bacterium]|nr:hypothetical protein [Anaerolineae bacterium]